MNGKKICTLIIGVTLIAGSIVVGVLNSTKDSTVVKSNVNTSKQNVFVREVDGSTYNEHTLNIMGYEPFDYAQAMSFILSQAKLSSHGIDGMNFNGITLEEHIINLNNVCYLEDVNPNIMLAQQMLETGYYGYVGSVVTPSDYNFAGIGAIDSGNGCNGFKDNYEGQLAQAQHLKAYASTEDLNTELVDPRFEFVERGKATTVAGLSKAWASNENYGEHITKLYTDMLNHEVDEDLVRQYKDKIY